MQVNTIQFLFLFFFLSTLLYFDIDMTFPQRNETAAVWEAERNAIGAWKIIEKLQNEKKKQNKKIQSYKIRFWAQIYYKYFRSLVTIEMSIWARISQWLALKIYGF